MWKTILIAAVVGIAAVAPAAELDAEKQAVVVAAGQNDTFAWAWLSELCDVVGHRLAGSRSMERAIDYSVRTLREAGVPGIGYRTHNEGYFDLHHSPADTLDKVDPKVLADNVAAAAGLVWAIAEAPDSLRELGVAPSTTSD